MLSDKFLPVTKAATATKFPPNALVAEAVEAKGAKLARFPPAEALKSASTKPCAF